MKTLYTSPETLVLQLEAERVIADSNNLNGDLPGLNPGNFTF